MSLGPGFIGRIRVVRDVHADVQRDRRRTEQVELVEVLGGHQIFTMQRVVGSGAAGRNTTIIRANYRTPEGAEFYKESVKLYEGLGADLDFNLLFSQQGHLTLAHSDRGIITAN